jgi:hypothetical protein
MRLSEAIQAADDLLLRGWCQGTLARGSDGDDTSPDAPTAVAWCIEGALCAAIGLNEGLHDWVRDWIIERLPKPYECVAEFNDDPNTTAADVHRFLQTCAAQAVEAESVYVGSKEVVYVPLEEVASVPSRA